MQLQDDMEHPELELKRRRRRTTSIIPDEADAEKNKNRIGTLPDEILIDIISRLSLYEAGRTSVFSRGWRDLWKFTSGSLDFVGDQHDPKTVDPTRFLTWVNQVLELHQAPYVDKLSISFRSRIDDYDDDGGSPSPIVNSIGRWIRFVLQKEARVFELQLFPGNQFPSPDLDTFSSLLVKLKSLRLVNVNIKDKTMEHLLSICPYLEKLSLQGSGYTKYLSVVSQSLKSLVVKHCHKLKSLVISSENLVSFEGFYNRDDPVYFDNVPLLSELKISGRSCQSFVLLPQHHSHYCGQLEKLLLLVRSEMVYYCTLLFRRQIELPRLHNLKQLELIFPQAGESILYFVLFTKACPSLSTMQVQFTDIDAQSQEYFDSLGFPTHLEEKNFAAEANFHHECLKVVKLIGFGAYKRENKFALSLIRIAKSLEKLIIEPGGHLHMYKRATEVNESAKILEANLPHEAALFLL